MTNRDGLLQAILADPADDAVRLVYADWLEEAGEGERAEFIRVQVEIAQNCREWPGGAVPWRPLARRETLQRRERELLTRDNFDVWPVNLPVTIAQNFRRGFVAALTCTAADWLAHADAILAVQPVEEVALTTWPGCASSVNGMPGIISVWIIPPGWTADGNGEACLLAERGRRVEAICRARWPRVRFTLPPAILETIFGVPIIVDPNLPPGDWQFGAPPNFEP